MEQSWGFNGNLKPEQCLILFYTVSQTCLSKYMKIWYVAGYLMCWVLTTNQPLWVCHLPQRKGEKRQN